MKLIIRQLLIALTLIAIIHESTCERERDARKYRLSRAFENIFKKINMKYESEIENIFEPDFDMDCVKNFLKLPQNNKMIVEEVEEMIFMVASLMKCSDGDKVFEAIFQQYTHRRMETRLPCLKRHLQQHEPTSKLIENFEINGEAIKECEEKFPIYKELTKFQKSIESILGPLNVYTCGAVSENGANDFITFISKGTVIKYGNITEELKKSEKEKLKDYFKDVSIRTVNCNLRKFEDDPQAFNVNNTLNYFYKKELAPMDDDHDYSNDYYKRLIKVEGTIDYDCVKKKLNLPENGELALIEVEATVIIASAKAKCIKVDHLEFSNFFIDFAVEDGQRFERPFACAKYKLQKLEPTSKLAVTSSTDESHEKYCRYHGIRLFPFSIPTWTYTDQVGRLNETTCGILTDEFVDVISLKTMLLLNEKDKELKINETKDLFGVVTEKLHKLADCILQRIK